MCARRGILYFSWILRYIWLLFQSSRPGSSLSVAVCRPSRTASRICRLPYPSSLLCPSAFQPTVSRPSPQTLLFPPPVLPPAPPPPPPQYHTVHNKTTMHRILKFAVSRLTIRFFVQSYFNQF